MVQRQLCELESSVLRPEIGPDHDAIVVLHDGLVFEPDNVLVQDAAYLSLVCVSEKV